MTGTAAVACVGIAVMDLVFDVETLPSEPTKHFAADYREVGGGPAATGAVAIARLGGEAHLWARVGRDDWGRRIVEDLKAERVQVDAIRKVPNAKSSVSAVMVDRAGERMIVNFGGQGLDEDPSWLPLTDLARFGAVLADLRWPRASVPALAAARHAGIPAILDADLTSGEGLSEAVAASSHVIFSHPALTQCTGDGETDSALLTAHAQFGGWLSVTMGSKGAFWTADGTTVHHQPAYEINVVDTLGAGDVFHGAFALALARGQEEAEALRWASGAAALKCSAPGGRAGIPTGEELNRFLMEQR